MIVYLLSSLAGRVAVVVLLALIAMPYVLRRNSTAMPGPYLRRMWPHFWGAYIVLALSTAHAWIAMSRTRGANRSGILAGNAGFILLIFEVAVGLALKAESSSMRRTLRRLHFWTMTAIAGTLGIHLWLNS